MCFIQDFCYFKREKAKLSFSFEITKVLNKTHGTSIQDPRVVKSTVEISQNFVDFSEYANFKKLNANLFSELLEGNGDGNVLFVPNEYSDTENDYANEIGEDSLNEQAKEKAFEDYYDQLLKNVV